MKITHYKKIRTAIKNGGTHIFFAALAVLKILLKPVLHQWGTNYIKVFRQVGAARKEISSSLGKFSFLDCKIFITIVFFTILFLPNYSFAQTSNPISLKVILQEALENNPKIKVAHNKWKAAEYKIKSVKSLEDPMASYGYFAEEAQTKVGPQEQKYGVSQKIPFPGKLNLKGKAQGKHALMLKEQYEATKIEILKDVKFVYYDLFWVDQAVEISEEEKSILEKIEKVAQRKYESNLVGQQDVIKVQVELSKLIKKLFLLRQNRKSLAVKLNSLLNRQQGQDAEVQKIMDVESKSFEYELDEIIKKAQNTRQELIVANLAIEKSQFEKSLAKMAYLPDFTFGAEYIEIGSGTTSLSNDGEDVWIGKVSINVPIWFGKLNAQVKEKEAQLEAAKKNKENVENHVNFEAQDLYFKIVAYKDIVLLYETALLPQAQQAFDSSQIGFETGSITFLDWLDTERTYLQTRLAYYKAITDYHKSIAFLERVVGEELSGGENEN